MSKVDVRSTLQITAVTITLTAQQDNLSLDHRTPWSHGGEDSFENFQTLCRSCNSRKGNRVGAP